MTGAKILYFSWTAGTKSTKFVYNRKILIISIILGSNRIYEEFRFVIYIDVCSAYLFLNVRWDSSVGAVYRYGLGGRGDWNPVGARFSSHVRLWDPPSFLYNEYRVFHGG
jgi:hypothetical protein